MELISSLAMTTTTTSTASTTPANYHPCYTSIYISMDGSNSSSGEFIQFLQQKAFITDALVNDRWNQFERIAVQLYADYRGGACIVPIAAYGQIHSYESFQSIINRIDGYVACEKRHFDDNFYL